MLLVINKLTSVTPTVFVSELAETMHEVSAPRPYILFSIDPRKLTFSIELVILPVALIVSIIDPLIFTIAMLETINKLTLVERPIFQLLLSSTIGFIVLPLPLVDFTTFLGVNTLSMWFILIKLARVNVTVGTYHLPLPLHHSIYPIAAILVAIFPFLDALSVLNPYFFSIGVYDQFHITNVFRAIFPVNAFSFLLALPHTGVDILCLNIFL